MGIAATGSTDLACEVAKATAQELSACGINWIFGPCLDVLTNVRKQPLGVRTAGDDPEEVSAYGIAYMKGYKEAGLATCGKHFPSYGNIEFVGSSLDVPMITDSLEQLSLSALVPYKNAIAHGIDSMMVGGCAMSSAGLNVMHACLSAQVVEGVLRTDLKYDGVVVSECLEMDALSHNIGVGGGTVMAVNAGCDIVLLCRAYGAQQQAIRGLKRGIENSVISTARIQQSLSRVLLLKSACTSWEKALSPQGISLLSKLQPSHTSLSTLAYDSSITVVRDNDRLLPLSNTIDREEDLLLLTPHVKPLPASAASKAYNETLSITSPEPTIWERGTSAYSGERVFREFGCSLYRQRNGRVLHTSYTATGVRPTHEELINRAGAIIIVTADANRNLYQFGFTKHVAIICSSQYASRGEKKEKPLIVVAVSSPYDFAMDHAIGTYICTYDFTETALNSLVKVLFGDVNPKGALPGTISQSQKLNSTRQHWLVETFNEERDGTALDELIQTMIESSSLVHHSELSGSSSNTFLLRRTDVTEAHFVVRNSSTKALYGFCSSYYFHTTGTGVIGALFVDPARRKLSIGHSLHDRAIRTLLQKEGAKRFQLGSRLPSLYLGIPSGHGLERKRLRSWFANLGWSTAMSRSVCSMIIRDLASWLSPDGMAKSLQSANADFDLVSGEDFESAILDHVKSSNRQGIAEIYKIALLDAGSCGIVRAKRPDNGNIIGTVVLYSARSILATFVPALKHLNQLAGGISSPVISPAVGDYSTLLQGLILLGTRTLKRQQCNACVLDYVSIFLMFQ